MTTLFLSSTGGHLHELDELAARLPPGRRLWVTHENAQSTSLLAGRDVEYLPYVRPRSPADVARCLPVARRLLRTHDLTAAVSTGSSIALGFLPYLAAHGVACHYVESAARTVGPSLTGAVLARCPRIRLWTQYAHLADSRWQHAGSVFDAYVPAAVPARDGHRIRVVVTVGTAHPFRRLVEHLVPLLAPGGPLERATGRPVEVTWQTGSTPVDDLPITANPLLPAADLDTALARADIVVAHAGAGSALAAFAAGRAPVLVDRRARFGEAPDDHQSQLAPELARRGLALARSVEEVQVADLLWARARGALRARECFPRLEPR
ncbi:glycosyltransferase [Pseudonocardia nematodicida]|uniref:Glycosyltransferase n=1 Tax=Pseudonocardia nematodicida TaxID=1206997 RepID=A0ABV1K4Q7_9PSEU